jgi:1-acyl-sn-glycerol-3-phosphate acyltransferase
MLRGLATLVLLTGNLLLWGSQVLAVGLVKVVVHFTAPRSRLRTRVILLLSSLASKWVEGNNRIFDRMLPTVWDVQGIPESVHPAGRYLVIGNHVSWVDAFVFFRIFHRRAAFIRFFLKQQLIWMPIVGLACWILEFPFMKRLSAETLERHPEKRGIDLATARRACQRYRHFPVAIGNFIEGTRFTRKKHAAQKSPYRRLLRPRTGGMALVIASFGDQLDEFIDVTLAYPGGETTMWDFISGKLRRITVRARAVDIPPEFLDSAITQPGPERERFKAWLDRLWREKDEALERLTALS